LLVGVEKCRSALGAERLLAPSRALGASSLSAPNATDRRAEPQMGGDCSGGGPGLGAVITWFLERVVALRRVDPERAQRMVEQIARRKA